MKNILAVGSSESTRDLIGNIVENGNRADSVNDGAELLRALDRGGADLILISPEELWRLVEAETAKLQRREEIVVGLLARTQEFRNDSGGDHIRRITGFVCAIMRHLPRDAASPYYISDTYYNDIKTAAALHDIGQVSIPDYILLKPGKLSAEEFEIIKSHAEVGANLLREALASYAEPSFLDTAIEIAEAHHEKWDGTGYPQGLAGEQIPLSGRLMAIADVYDALTSKRPYKPPLSHDRAMAIIAESSGKHFDPVLVDVFLSIGAEIGVIAKA